MEQSEVYLCKCNAILECKTLAFFFPANFFPIMDQNDLDLEISCSAIRDQVTILLLCQFFKSKLDWITLIQIHTFSDFQITYSDLIQKFDSVCLSTALFECSIVFESLLWMLAEETECWFPDSQLADCTDPRLILRLLEQCFSTFILQFLISKKKSHGTPLSTKIKSTNFVFFFFSSPIIKQCFIRVGILALYMIRHLHLTFSENHVQTALRFLMSKWSVFCPSLERLHLRPKIYPFHQFTGYKVYCSYMSTRFFFLFNTLGQNFRI